MHRAPGPLHFLLTGLRTKPRVALAVGLGVFAASAAWTFSRPKIYEARAGLRVWRPPESTAPALGANDFHALLKIAESRLMLKRVADRSYPEADQLTHGVRGDLADALEARRQVQADAASGMVSIIIRDRDPILAAKLANRFLDEMPYEHGRRLGYSCERFRAHPPGSSFYVSPDLPLHLGAGLLAGVVLGASAAGFAARPGSASSAEGTGA